MRLGIKQFLAVAGLTALESVRQPVYLLLTASCLLVTGLFPVLVTHTLSDGARMIRDCALALYFLSGLILGSLTAAYALSRDIRRGTATAVLSKPVGRALFFLAKFAGIALALLLFSALMTAAAILSTRTVLPESYRFDWWGGGPLVLAIPLAFAVAGVQNYFTRCAFASRAVLWLALFETAALLLSCAVDAEGKWGDFGAALPWRVAPAGALIALAILVLAAGATALATRLEAIPVLSLCTGLFLLGLVSDYLAGQLAPAQRRWLGPLIDLLPNWQNFWVVDALNADGIPLSYLLHAAGYAALCLAGLLAAGMLAFHRMEVR